jgi:hypothetical protein
MAWTDWIGKKVFLETKKGHQYSGYVIQVDDDNCGMILITIKDKFDKLVCFASGELAIIREEGY